MKEEEEQEISISEDLDWQFDKYAFSIAN